MGMEYRGFHPYFGIRHNYDGRVVSSTRLLHFTPKEIPWYSFLSEAEWIPVFTERGQKERVTWKFPRSLPVIEPGTRSSNAEIKKDRNETFVWRGQGPTHLYNNNNNNNNYHLMQCLALLCIFRLSQASGEWS